MDKDKKVKLSEITKFSDKQLLATRMADEFRFVLYGGAAGGGKSYWLRWYPIRWLIKTFKETGVQGIVAGLFCEDYPALKDRHLGKMQNEFPPWLGKLSESTVSGLSFKLAPEYGGGVLALRNLDDPSRYFSSEFALIAVDELTKNRRETFDFLRMRNRWASKEGSPRIKTRFIAGTNPGGVGHDWVKKIWLDKVFDETELEKEQFQYIPATVYDNPYLDEYYIRSLKSLPSRLQKAYLEGNWDLFEGQYFSEWNTTHHVCEPFTIPDGWKKFRSYDHGREAPAVCGWYAVDFDGRVWKYREYYKAGQNIDQIAEEVNRLSEGEHYEYSIADPSMFSHSGFVDKSGGQTIAESFANHGIMFIPASNRRIDGWSIMHSYLAWSDEDKEKGTPLTHPRLIFFKTCYNSIRTIPTLIHDEHNPEDLKSRSEDHCFVGDTLVDTILGKKKIKDLVGKEVYVNTLEGFRKCRSVRKTRKSEVWEVEFTNGKKVEVTPDHRFLTKSGWKELQSIDIGFDELIQSGICIKSYLQLFKNLMVYVTTYAGSIFRNAVFGFTELFGSSLISLPYQKDFTSTIRIKTEPTIKSKILNYLTLTNTSPFMRVHRNIAPKAEILLKNTHNLKLLNGMARKLDEHGTVFMRKIWQLGGFGLRSVVSYAIRNIQRLNNLLVWQNTVIKIVKLQPCGVEEVYDLTVLEAEHFTIEGGIVVHNCADECRYLLTSLHEAHSQRPLTGIEKKLYDMYHKEEDFNTRYYGNK